MQKSQSSPPRSLKLLAVIFVLSANLFAQDDPTKQLATAFSLTSSGQATFAQDLDEATFYVQLNVTNLRGDLTGTKCVDKSFITWVRKFFKNDAKSISVLASVTMPDNTVQKIPLFQVSMDEGAHPPKCLTNILTSEPITPLFVARKTEVFKLDVQALTQENVTINAASTTVAAASDLLSMTGGSAWLMKNVATTQTQVAAAVQKIDTSLSNNWSATTQTDYQFVLSAWPQNNDWSHHLDQANFAVGSLAAKASGIAVDPNLIPTLAISFQYTPSLFGTGLGHYLPEDQILATHLASNAGDSLVNILKLGVGGFTTDQALSISDSTAMTRFCNGMRENFANFLTADDSLAARHAVLFRSTAYYNSAVLKNAPGCESDNEVMRLKQLGSSFVFPADIDSLAHANRSAFVKSRGAIITTALLSGSQDKITSVAADPAKFALLIENDVTTVFPNLVEGQPVGGIGNQAITQLAGAGAFRSGCWAALPTQNLRNLVGMVLNKKTNINSAILVEFDSDFPGLNTDPSKDVPKITKISFFPVAIIQSLASLPNWPDDSCPLN